MDFSKKWYWTKNMLLIKLQIFQNIKKIANFYIEFHINLVKIVDFSHMNTILLGQYHF